MAYGPGRRPRRDRHCISLSSTLNDSRIDGSAMFSPLTIASYAFTRPTVSSDLIVEMQQLQDVHVPHAEPSNGSPVRPLKTRSCPTPTHPRQLAMRKLPELDELILRASVPS
jgi:hypothetical protein